MRLYFYCWNSSTHPTSAMALVDSTIIVTIVYIKVHMCSWIRWKKTWQRLKFSSESCKVIGSFLSTGSRVVTCVTCWHLCQSRVVIWEQWYISTSTQVLDSGLFLFRQYILILAITAQYTVLSAYYLLPRHNFRGDDRSRIDGGIYYLISKF